MHGFDSARMPDDSVLTTLEAQAWGALMRAHVILVRGLDSDLRAAHGLALGDFEILTLLKRESCQPLRMTALAGSTVLSPSGLSRAIERLEARKLVRRDRCPDDRRGTLAQLTESGAALLEAAGSSYTSAIRERFFQRLTNEQLEALTEALLSVLAEESDACCHAALHIDVAARTDPMEASTVSPEDGKARSQHSKSYRGPK